MEILNLCDGFLEIDVNLLLTKTIRLVSVQLDIDNQALSSIFSYR